MHVATHTVTLYSVTKVIPIATCLNHQQTFSDASVKQPAYKWVYTQKNERRKKMRKSIAVMMKIKISLGSSGDNQTSPLKYRH